MNTEELKAKAQEYLQLEKHEHFKKKWKNSWRKRTGRI